MKYYLWKRGVDPLGIPAATRSPVIVTFTSNADQYLNKPKFWEDKKRIVLDLIKNQGIK